MTLKESVMCISLVEQISKKNKFEPLYVYMSLCRLYVGVCNHKTTFTDLVMQKKFKQKIKEIY